MFSFRIFEVLISISAFIFYMEIFFFIKQAVVAPSEKLDIYIFKRFLGLIIVI